MSRHLAMITKHLPSVRSRLASRRMCAIVSLLSNQCCVIKFIIKLHTNWSIDICLSGGTCLNIKCNRLIHDMGHRVKTSLFFLLENNIVGLNEYGQGFHHDQIASDYLVLFIESNKKLHKLLILNHFMDGNATSTF